MRSLDAARANRPWALRCRDGIADADVDPRWRCHVPDLNDALQRPLGLLAFESDLQADSELIAMLDGVLNLLSKANKALERGPSAERSRAMALLDRAETHLEGASRPLP
jgi:hypothetical protein